MNVIKEILEKQLRLLSEKSNDSDAETLYRLTEAMIDVAKALGELTPFAK